jgi:ribose-phosphate pyrophosphokinase
MRDLLVFSGNSHPSLAAAICKRLQVPLSNSTSSKFSNGELNIEMDESVRDSDVYIIQTASSSVNDAIIELLIMISACKIASARYSTTMRLILSC